MCTRERLGSGDLYHTCFYHLKLRWQIAFFASDQSRCNLQALAFNDGEDEKIFPSSLRNVLCTCFRGLCWEYTQILINQGTAYLHSFQLVSNARRPSHVSAYRFNGISPSFIAHERLSRSFPVHNLKKAAVLACTSTRSWPTCIEHIWLHAAHKTILLNECTIRKTFEKPDTAEGDFNLSHLKSIFYCRLEI